MEDTTVILETVKSLGVILVTLIPIVLGVVQIIKEKFKMSGNAAEVVSLVAGFLSSGLVALVYANGFAYALELGQWVGLGLFVVIGTIGPSGGYKLLGVYSGTRQLG